MPLEVVKLGPYNQVCDLGRQRWQNRAWREQNCPERGQMINDKGLGCCNGVDMMAGESGDGGKEKEELDMMP